MTCLNFESKGITKIIVLTKSFIANSKWIEQTNQTFNCGAIQRHSPTPRDTSSSLFCLIPFNCGANPLIVVVQYTMRCHHSYFLRFGQLHMSWDWKLISINLRNGQLKGSNLGGESLCCMLYIESWIYFIIITFFLPYHLFSSLCLLIITNLDLVIYRIFKRLFLMGNFCS